MALSLQTNPILTTSFVVRSQNMAEEWPCQPQVLWPLVMVVPWPYLSPSAKFWLCSSSPVTVSFVLDLKCYSNRLIFSSSSQILSIPSWVLSFVEFPVYFQVPCIFKHAQNLLLHTDALKAFALSSWSPQLCQLRYFRHPSQTQPFIRKSHTYTVPHL